MKTTEILHEFPSKRWFRRGIHSLRSPVAPTPWGTGGTCPHFYKWLGTGGGHRE